MPDGRLLRVVTAGDELLSRRSFSKLRRAARSAKRRAD
jgi:hypothetical protein